MKLDPLAHISSIKFHSDIMIMISHKINPNWSPLLILEHNEKLLVSKHSSYHNKNI